MENNNNVKVKVFKETERSYINVKNFLRNVQKQSSETTFLPVKEVMYDKENKTMGLREIHGIDTTYSYGFLVKHNVLEWNGEKGKSALVRWCAKENLDELTVKLKTINGKSKKLNSFKNNKSSDIVIEYGENNGNVKKQLKDDVENPIQALVDNNVEEKSNTKTTKKDFLDLILKLSKENTNLDKKMNRIIFLLEKPIEEKSKIIIDGLMKEMKNGL